MWRIPPPAGKLGRGLTFDGRIATLIAKKRPG
jgi:hypothetical protein